MAKLESLIVDMQLETAELRKGLDEIKKKLEETSKAAEGLLNFEQLKEVGHIAVEAGEQLAELVHHGAELADQMGKMAQSSGVSVESFSRLSYAAGLSKVSNEELGVAFKKLNVNVAEAAAGSTKQAALFRALGVSVKDASGNVRAADDVMADLAERFSGMQDGASKSALAVEIFGKAGAQMIPFLNEGRDGLKELGDEADRFGVTVSGTTVRAATEFNDNLHRMQKAIEGIAIRVAADLSPGLAELTSQMVKSKDAADGFAQTAAFIADALRVVASIAAAVAGGFREVGKDIASAGVQLFNAFTGNAKANLDVQKQSSEESKKIWAETGAQLDAIWKKTEKAMTLPELDFRKTGDEIYKGFKHGADGAKELNDLLRDMLAAKRELDKITFNAQESYAKKSGEIGSEGAAQKQAFADVGKEASEILKQATAGFLNFNAAINAKVNNLIDAQEKLRDATIAEAEGAYQDADKYRAQAAVLDAAAKKAGAAADAFKKIAEGVAKEANTIQGAMQALGQAVLQAVPRLNELVQAAQQGASVGGGWGALIAVFVQLASKTEAFKTILAIIDHDLDGVITAINPLVTGIADLMKGMGSLSDGITGMIAPIFKVIGDLLSRLAPLLSSLMENLAPAMGVMSLIGDALSPIIELIGLIATLLKLFAEPLKFFSMIITLVSTILKLVMVPLTLLGELFKGLADAIGGPDGIGKIEVWFSWLSNRIAEFGDWVSKLGERIKNLVEHQVFMTDAEREEALHPTQKSQTDRGGPKGDQGLDSGGVDRNGPIAGTAGAVDDLGNSAGKASTALSKLSEAFANVPEGFRRALRTLQATDPVAAAAGGYGEIAMAPRPNAVYITVNGSLIHENALLELIEQRQQRKLFQRTGKP